ncbi:MAG: MASE3 domain-containing protein [Eubacteriales bacterium]
MDTSFSSIKKLIQGKNSKILLTRYLVVLFSCLAIAKLIFPFWIRYLIVFNTVFELIYIFICVAMFLVVWHTHERLEPINIIIGYGLLAVALCDTLVIFFFPEMGIYPKGYYDLSARYWLLARFGEGIVLLISTRKTFQVILDKWLGLLIALVVAIIFVGCIYNYQGVFPVLLTKSGTATKAKVYLEYSVALIYFAALYSLRDRLDNKELFTYRNIFFALLISIHAQLSFALNEMYFSFFSTFGHLLKVVSFYFLYKGIFVSVITYPHAKLVQSKEKIYFQENLLDQVCNAVIVTDFDGRIIYWNKFAQDLYGWTAYEVMAKNITEVIIPPENGRFDLVREKVLDNGYMKGDFVNQTKSGARLFIHTALSLLKDGEGKPFGIVGINTDITERREIEDKMARLDRLNFVGEMAASIGHEIRNPLTSVKGFLQLIASKDRDSKEKEFLEISIKELDRANSIITEYLSLAKDKRIDAKLNNVNNILNSVVPLLQADAFMSDKNIKMELENIPEIYVDKKECTQLIINLVRNGLEAMSSGGILTIKTFVDNGEIVLAVSDQGPGIAREILGKLGTPFITTKEAGTGLGLAVCYSIAARHNASISVETGSAGTTFFVRFS